MNSKCKWSLHQIASTGWDEIGYCRDRDQLLSQLKVSMKPVRLLPSVIHSNVSLQLMYDYDDDFEDDSTIVECQFELHGWGLSCVVVCRSVLLRITRLLSCLDAEVSWSRPVGSWKYSTVTWGCVPRCRILQTTSTFKSKELKEEFLTDLVDGCKTFRTEEQNSIQGVEIDAAPGFSSGSYLTTDTLPVNLVNHVNHFFTCESWFTRFIEYEKLDLLIFCGGVQQEQLHLWVSKQVHIRTSFTVWTMQRCGKRFVDICDGCSETKTKHWRVSKRFQTNSSTTDQAVCQPCQPSGNDPLVLY